MSKARDTVETLRTVLVDGDVTNANFTGADLEIAKGGTGASSAGAARTALGVVIGTDVLAPDGDGSALTGVDSLPSQTSQSGKFLTTNGSAASWGEAGGGAWNLLSTVTASSASTVDIETTFDSTYDTYALVISGMITDNNYNSTWLRFKMGGSYATNTNYRFHHHHSSTSAITYDATKGVNGSTNAIMVSYGTYGTSLGNSSIVMYIPFPSSTTRAKIIQATGVSLGGNNSGRSINTYGINYNTDALTGLRFFATAGNLTGIFRLYGISNS